MKILAQGHSGEYWLAINKINNSKVVIKKPTAAISVEMLGQEIDAVLKSKHPNVIQLINAYVNPTEQTSLLYFEYAEKGQLKNYLQTVHKQSSINMTKLLAMAAGVACGMSELQKKRVIHCDLKASNILLDGDLVCKIASFNKAQCLKDDEEYKICNPYHLAIRWQAPEVLSSKKFSTKSDVWSFGVLMAEIFSYGGRPYPNMETEEVKNLVLHKKKMMAQPCGCSKEVYNLMKECLRFHEENRFPFTAVHKALKQLHAKHFKKDSDTSVSEFED